MKRDLLVIERNTRDSLRDRLTAEGYSVCLAETAGVGLEALGQHKITHAVILNAISMRTNGARTCASLKRAAPRIPVLIYSDQKKPAKADELLQPGITIRKLINRIELYSPMDKKSCLQYGEIYLDEEKQRGVFCTSPQKGSIQSLRNPNLPPDKILNHRFKIDGRGWI